MKGKDTQRDPLGGGTELIFPSERPCRGRLSLPPGLRPAPDWGRRQMTFRLDESSLFLFRGEVFIPRQADAPAAQKGVRGLFVGPSGSFLEVVFVCVFL